MTDFSNTTTEGLVVEPDLGAFMATMQTTFMQLVDARKAGSSTVFDGSAGRALLYLRMYDLNGNPEDLASARSYADAALADVDNLNADYVGFLWGSPGVYSVAAAVLDRCGDASETVEELVGRVEAAFAAAPTSAPFDDWDSGRAGLLYAAEFLEENVVFNNSLRRSRSGEVSASDASIIPRETVTAVAEAVVTRGASLSREEGYMEFVSPNDGEMWLGQSHGSAGVLHGLLRYAPEIFTSNATARGLILGTLDHIVSKQQESGNFPSEYYDDDADVLVQWDHGAPGVMSVLAEASLKLLQLAAVNPDNATAPMTWDEARPYVQRYVASALKAADCTWERGLLTKGLQMCHGITGNTYMQLRLASLVRQINSEGLQFGLSAVANPDTYVWRALQFQRFVMNTPELNDPNLMRKPTPDPFAVYTASYESAAVIFQDLVAHADDPISARGMLAY
jgi:hypothetical protein